MLRAATRAKFAAQSHRLLVKNPNAAQLDVVVAAVGVKHLPGHVAGILAGEEQEARRDLVGLAGPAHRRVLAELGDLLRRLAADGLSGVQIGPGATPFTRMPFLTRFLASERVKPSDRPFGGAIVEQSGEPLYVVSDVQLMIAEPFLRCGSAAWVRKNMPKMLVWKVRFSWSSVMSRMSLS